MNQKKIIGNANYKTGRKRQKRMANKTSKKSIRRATIRIWTDF